MDSETPKTKHRRRQFLINRQFQLRWLALIGGIILVAGASILLVNAIIQVGQLDADIEMAGLSAGPEMMLSPQAAVVLWVVIAALIWIVFRATHTIAGPLYNIERVLTEVAAGNYDVADARLRRKDEFKELAEAVNNLLGTLRTRRDRGRETLEFVSRQVDELAQALGGQRALEPATQERLTQLKEACAKLEDSIK